MGVGAAYLLLFVRISIPTERSHLVEYGVLGGLILLALLERRENGAGPRQTALVALLLTVGVGLANELVQAVIPSRVFDPIDIMFNSGAALLAIGGIMTIRWIVARSD